MDPLEASRNFEIPATPVKAEPVGRGNINDTYMVFLSRACRAEESIILQKINTHVFPKPQWIMANMRAVTDHIGRKLKSIDPGAGRFRFPVVIPARDGLDYFVDPDGGFWRSITTIRGASSYYEVQGTKHAEETGAMLGLFHLLTSDMDMSVLRDTLPGYHVCPAYLAAYDRTVAKTRSNPRTDGTGAVEELTKFIEERRELAGLLDRARESGDIRLMVTHGDPKVDNIMIDDTTGRSVGMIDLDTVKPGLIHCDFGDAMRSACNPAGEDAEDMEAVEFDAGLCGALARGYMFRAGSMLTTADRALLYDSIRLLIFELAVRFFEDYLAGDVYFKVRYEGHSLHRAQVQARLCLSAERQKSEIMAALSC